MAEKGAAKEQGKKGGKGKLLIIGAVVLIAAAAGYLVLGKGGGKQADAKKKPKLPPGEILPLDSTTVNLADGRYLKVGVALQLTKSASAEEMQKEEAKAQDATIALFSARTSAQLMTRTGKAQAKKELSRRVAKLYEDKVLGIYLTEFVIQ
jgi:flagellar FliL protein